MFDISTYFEPVLFWVWSISSWECVRTLLFLWKVSQVVGICTVAYYTFDWIRTVTNFSSDRFTDLSISDDVTMHELTSGGWRRYPPPLSHPPRAVQRHCLGQRFGSVD